MKDTTAPATWAPWPDPIPQALPEARDPGPPSAWTQRAQALGGLVLILAVPVMLAGLWVQAALMPGVAGLAAGFALLFVPGFIGRNAERRLWRLVRMAQANGWAMRILARPVEQGQSGRRRGAKAGGVALGVGPARRPVDPVTIWLAAEFPGVMQGPARLPHDPVAVFCGRAEGVDFALTLLEAERHLGLAAAPLKTDRRGRKADFGLTYQVFAAFRVAPAEPAPRVAGRVDVGTGTALAPTPALDRARRDHKAEAMVRPGVVWVLAEEVIHSPDPEVIAAEMGAFVAALAEAAVEAAGG
jgi:hypothetical protein